VPHTTPDYDFEAAATFINSSIQWILASYSILSPPPSVSLLVHDDEQHYKSEGQSGGKDNGRDRFDCGGELLPQHTCVQTLLSFTGKQMRGSKLPSIQKRSYRASMFKLLK